VCTCYFVRGAYCSQKLPLVDENGGGSNGKTEFEWMPSGGLKALTWVDPLLWMLMWGM